MKAILMSIRPRHDKNILNGIKILEIRRKFPIDYVGWVYIYNTKDIKDGYLTNAYINGKLEFITSFNKHEKYCGKVVARFWCDKVEEIEPSTTDNFVKDSCLTIQELENYLWSNILFGYAIHITKLEIFDKPKEISEFYKLGYGNIKPQGELRDKVVAYYNDALKYQLTRAPQSWCYIEV